VTSGDLGAALSSLGSGVHRENLAVNDPDPRLRPATGIEYHQAVPAHGFTEVRNLFATLMALTEVFSQNPCTLDETAL
jgi:hypothetical protein